LLKAIILYESRYGNTKLAAEKIEEGIKPVGGISTEINELKKFNINRIAEYDAIFLGSPNHFGGPTRGVKNFIDKLGKLDLRDKSIAVFDTYMGKDFEKAVKKMENRIHEKVAGLRILAPGLSVRVQGFKGPIPEEELLKCVEFGNAIGAQIKAQSFEPEATTSRQSRRFKI
jgi:flavorubredoxin